LKKSGQLHVPDDSQQGKQVLEHLNGGRVIPRAGNDILEKKNKSVSEESNLVSLIGIYQFSK
jgi:hypothetical protein